jgi:hypothetical protein
MEFNLEKDITLLLDTICKSDDKLRKIIYNYHFVHNGINYCELKKCRCGLIKSWNIRTDQKHNITKHKKYN